MPLYRHPKSPCWWVRFSVGGVKIRRSSGTTDRNAAEEFETRLRAELWRQHRLGERPRYTWQEAVARWYAEADNRGRERDKERLDWFSEYLNDLPLVDITRDVIEKARQLRAKESSPSTANRYMAGLRMILRKAWRDWDWIEKAPVVPMFRVERSEPRYLTRQQFASLLKHLPKHLQDMAVFSTETGLRMRNVTGLQWPQVALSRRLVIVPAGNAKAGETISVPLNDRAVAVLKGQPGRTGAVFRFRGKAVDDANGKAFRDAAAAAGVPWLRWHDLRHTWASWHIQAGTPLHVLQELGGWQSYEMVRRYAHLSAGHLAAFADHKMGTPKRDRRAR